MMQRKLSRAYNAYRLLFPAFRQRAYARQVRASGLFDRDFYLGVNQYLHPLAKALPLRHYILLGERMGLQPNPEFSPRAYLQHNPDVDAEGLKPLEHFLRIGRSEGRLTRALYKEISAANVPLPVIRPDSSAANPDAPAPFAPAPFAIVAHVYYHELWSELSETIRRQSLEFDLFVSFTALEDTSKDLRAAILADFPKARVYEMPNHGRDIFPFVHLVNSGVLQPYRAVCKLHTKKSPHRVDGDAWRQHLIRGVLGAPGRTQDRLKRFLADRSAAFWVADGQFYDDTRWWGSNLQRVTGLLHRLEVRVDPDKLSFPAGSIYWLKPMMLDMLRGMKLTYADFEAEQGQVDGTTAHAIERALGYIAKAAAQTVVQTSELDQPGSGKIPPATRPRLVSAFYLPQFHPVPENDAWWGKGFTEWRGVVNARPTYPGHHQPALPGELGFYDLRLPEVMAEQSALARKAGIDAFCVYHYWFDGRRILERPIDNLLASPAVDFPFYLCWANESWRRNWDGLSGEILLGQTYKQGFAEDLAASLVPYFNDPRYQRPDGKRPRFVIYRPDDMPDPPAAIAAMRATWHALGIGEVELGAVRFHIEGENPVAEYLFDFWVEMPPHGLVTADDYLVGGPDEPRLDVTPKPGFHGLIYDYRALADTSMTHKYLTDLPQNTIAGIMPGWDNTARRGMGAHIAHGANPAAFSRWLDRILASRIAGSYQNELFINAWNEWAEKAVMEPCEQYGDAYLRCLSDALRTPTENQGFPLGGPVALRQKPL